MSIKRIWIVLGTLLAGSALAAALYFAMPHVSQPCEIPWALISDPPSLDPSRIEFPSENRLVERPNNESEIIQIRCPTSAHDGIVEVVAYMDHPELSTGDWSREEIRILAKSRLIAAASEVGMYSREWIWDALDHASDKEIPIGRRIPDRSHPVVFYRERRQDDVWAVSAALYAEDLRRFHDPELTLEKWLARFEPGPGEDP